MRSIRFDIAPWTGISSETVRCTYNPELLADRACSQPNLPRCCSASAVGACYTMLKHIMWGAPGSFTQIKHGCNYSANIRFWWELQISEISLNILWGSCLDPGAYSAQTWILLQCQHSILVGAQEVWGTKRSACEEV